MYVKITDCGSVQKYMITEKMKYKPQYAPLPKGTVVRDSDGNEMNLPDGSRWFIDKNGIIRQTKKSECKGDNIDSLKRSFARLRDLINCNCIEPENVLFITATYDPKRLKSELTLKKVSHDMRNFFYKMRQKGYRFEYVYTVEQQGNGNWHTHVLMFFEDKAPYIKQESLDRYWNKGFIRISKRFDDRSIKNIGAYVVADMTYGEVCGEHGHVKFKRLLSYPSGSRLYRCSKGIKRPETYITDETALHELEDVEPIYEKTTYINYGHVPDVYVYRHYALTDIEDAI